MNIHLLVRLGGASGLSLLLITPSFAFRDTRNFWAENCIQQLASRNIIGGYADGTFRPDNPVTRAEFATMVSRAFLTGAGRTSMGFRDVPPSFWAYDAINQAASAGFMSGYPDGTFRPEQNISRVQVLVALSSGLNLNPTEAPDVTLNRLYRDADAIPNYARPGVAAASERQLVVNYPDVTLLRPNQWATRADVAASLCQSLQLAGIPSQYIANATLATPVQTPVATLPQGTLIVARLGNQRVIVTPQDTLPLTLTVAQDVRDSRGRVVLPAGSTITGRLQPAGQGSQFVAQQVNVRGQSLPLDATSAPVRQTREISERSLRPILPGALVGTAAAALIAGVSGDRRIEAGEVLAGTVAGAAAGLNWGRRPEKALRDFGIGAGIGAAIGGLSGDRRITAAEVLGGAVLGSVVGGAADRQQVREVIVLEPNSDLVLTVNQPVNVPLP
ncbi:MAG: S-layer homology domain-containing protein [Gloeomargarita sp. SKYBB_i_bin120]|nr:S-layer homology domain-containing protein [Gloeomargarita sp. SKYB120]MDW8177025.1 S-layer homology domain-containing protein [Gloeomargarita sp. SKYBB_i_bin120]